MPKNNTLGERVRELRLAKKMTQPELAKEAKIDFTYISKIENDKMKPGERVIKKLAGVLAKDDISYENLYEELMLLNNKIPETLKRDILNHKKELLGELHRPGSSDRSLYRKYRELCEMRE